VVPAIPGYEVVRLLGRGGMGAVYLARHHRLGRLVAVKMILAGAQAGPERTERFLREARALARLRHPHILQVHDLAEHDGLPFMALEYVEGGSLADRLRAGPLPPTETARLIEVLAEAVHHAHREGVVHRDLKPANVLLTADGTPKVADFGLARLREADDRLTHSGAVVGTPAYMAPEQARGDEAAVGPATDVWALGAVLYECLTGRPAFQGASAYETLRQAVETDPTPPRRLRPETPAALEAVCLKCLEKQPGGRYAGASELAAALRAFREGAPPPTAFPRRRRRRWWVAAAALGAAALLAAVAWPFLKPPPPAGGGGPAADGATPDDGPRGAPGEKPAEAPKGPARFRERASWKEDGLGALGPLALSPDGKWIAVPRGLNHLTVRETATGDLRGPTLYPQAPLSCLAFEPYGNRLASGYSTNLTLALWAPPEKESPRRWDGPGSPARVAFAPRGGRLAVTFSTHPVLDQPRLVCLLDPDAEQPLARVEHTGDVRAMTFSPDGAVLASGGADRTVVLVDAATGARLHTFEHDGEVECLAFSPDGRLLAVGQGAPRVGDAGGGAATVWDVPARKEAVKLEGKWPRPIRGVAFSGDGRVLATSEGVEVRFWDAGSGRLRSSLPATFAGLGEVRFLPGGDAAALWGDHSLRLWDVRDGHDEAGTVVAGYDALVLSADGGTAAGWKAGDTVRVWDVVREGAAGPGGKK
jgi:WD40 repeat protein